MALPPPRDVPTTPAIQAPSINTLYEVNDVDEKGRGAFSRVVTGTHIATRQVRAIKIMERSFLTGKKADMVAHEKEILRRTRHPSIIHLHECVMTPDRVYMVMDLMSGDLFEYIVKVKRLSEGDTALVMRQLLSAVAYLHDCSVIHRDIKPENILINSPSDIKLADFGLAKVVNDWDVRSTPCGTSFYIAPEIIRGIEANGARPLCTTRDEVKFVDLWSCGVVMFVLLAGRPPFTGQVRSSQERRALLAKIDRGLLFPADQWASISEDAKDIVARLLTQDVTFRITAHKALDHPFFKAHPPAPATAPAPAPVPAPGATAETVAPPAPAAQAEQPPPQQQQQPAAPPVVGAAVAEEASPNVDSRVLAEGLNAWQQELREAGDQEGDESSYNVERKAAAPAPKVAMSKFPGPKKAPAA